MTMEFFARPPGRNRKYHTIYTPHTPQRRFSPVIAPQSTIRPKTAVSTTRPRSLLYGF